MRTLVAGWFSFTDGTATAGDCLAAEVLCDWLDEFGSAYDIAVDPPFSGGIDWRTADPAAYDNVVFVCGPFDDNPNEQRFLERFAACNTIGLNLSMMQPVERWNPFDTLIERDSSARSRPDMVFGSRADRVPVVGVCLVEPYGAPGEEDLLAAVERLIAGRPMAAVPIDTRLDVNITGLTSPAEVESLIARMDLVVTTRLHGTVLALKNGVPVVALDSGGENRKIQRLVENVGWPVLLTPDDITDRSLGEAFDFCLTAAARALAAECGARGALAVCATRDELVLALRGSLDAPPVAAVATVAATRSPRLATTLPRIVRRPEMPTVEPVAGWKRATKHCLRPVVRRFPVVREVAEDVLRTARRSQGR